MKKIWPDVRILIIAHYKVDLAGDRAHTKVYQKKVVN